MVGHDPHRKPAFAAGFIGHFRRELTGSVAVHAAGFHIHRFSLFADGAQCRQLAVIQLARAHLPALIDQDQPSR